MGRMSSRLNSLIGLSGSLSDWQDSICEAFSVLTVAYDICPGFVWRLRRDFNVCGRGLFWTKCHKWWMDREKKRFLHNILFGTMLPILSKTHTRCISQTCYLLLLISKFAKLVWWSSAVWSSFGALTVIGKKTVSVAWVQRLMMTRTNPVPNIGLFYNCHSLHGQPQEKQHETFSIFGDCICNFPQHLLADSR